MKKFTEPEIKVERFEMDDVLTTSGNDDQLPMG